MIPEMDIHIRGLTKQYPPKTVIQSLDLEIAQGSFVSIVGPSGCGKSSLLRLIAGLEKPTAGDIRLSAAAKESCGFVFQEANLLPWRSVYENVLLPLELNPSFGVLTATEKRKRVLSALKKVKLEGAQKLFPHELSGGMKMRISLARALVSSSRLLLMDEPFAALDEITRFEMQNQLLELWRHEKMTILFVTHSLFEATFLAERVIMLKSPGAVKFLDQKVELPTPRTENLRTSESLNKIVRELLMRLKE